MSPGIPLSFNSWAFLSFTVFFAYADCRYLSEHSTVLLARYKPIEFIVEIS